MSRVGDGKKFAKDDILCPNVQAGLLGEVQLPTTHSPTCTVLRRANSKALDGESISRCILTHYRPKAPCDTFQSQNVTDQMLRTLCVVTIHTVLRQVCSSGKFRAVLCALRTKSGTFGETHQLHASQSTTILQSTKTVRFPIN